MIERWIGTVDRTPATRVKLLAMVHRVFGRAGKVRGLKVNPVDDVASFETGGQGVPGPRGRIG